MDLISQTTLLGAAGASKESYWFAQLTGSDYVRPIAIKADALGNVYVAAEYSPSSPTRFLLVKYGKSGVLQWQRVLTGSATTIAKSLAIDSANNIYIMGYTESSGGAGSADFYFAKYDPTGAIQWQRSLGSASSEEGEAIAISSNDSVYVTGKFAGPTYGLAKYSTDGTLQWQRSISTNGGYTFGCSTDSSDNVYVCGTLNFGPRNFYVAKFNSSGTVQWQRTIAPGHDIIAAKIKSDAAGDIYVVGEFSTNSSGFICKINTSGTLLWQKSVTQSGTSFHTSTVPVQDVALDSEGNCFAFLRQSDGAGIWRIQVIKMDSSGNTLFQRRITDTSLTLFFGGDADSKGNFYFCARINSSIDNALLGKLPADGTLTGTYSSITYSVNDATIANTSFNLDSVSQTVSTSTFSSLSRSLTDSAGSVPSSTIIVG
jgi:hypothetical protein